MSVDNQPQNRRRLLVALVAGVFALVAVGVATLLVNIAERKEQAKHAYVKVVEVTENDLDAEKWGKNWPREYDAYKRTAEPTSTSVKETATSRTARMMRSTRRCSLSINPGNRAAPENCAGFCDPRPSAPTPDETARRAPASPDAAGP